jgi:hypothetical protein
MTANAAARIRSGAASGAAAPSAATPDAADR